jgi:hypothetical protein
MKLAAGVKIAHLQKTVQVSDEITRRAGNFHHLHEPKKRGLDAGKGQKRPCQQLDPDFRQLLTLKKYHVSLKYFGEKKCFIQKR